MDVQSRRPSQQPGTGCGGLGGGPFGGGQDFGCERQKAETLFLYEPGFGGGADPEVIRLPVEYRDGSAFAQTGSSPAYADGPIPRHGGQGTGAGGGRLQSDAWGDQRGGCGAAPVPSTVQLLDGPRHPECLSAPLRRRWQ